MVEGFRFISWNILKVTYIFLNVVGPSGRVGIPLILGTAALGLEMLNPNP